MKIDLNVLFSSCALASVSSALSNQLRSDQCLPPSKGISYRECAIDGQPEITSPKSGIPGHSSNTEPMCTYHLEHIDDKLCVYAYPGFDNDRGISIFTTPTIAKVFEPRLGGLVNSDQDTTPTKIPLNTLHTSLDLQTLPNRGLGLIATSPILAGTLLSQSHPILLVHNKPTPRPYIREPHLLYAVSILSPETQHLFNNLARSHPDLPNVHAQDIIKTNTFAIDIEGQAHLAIFPEASRFNHDCAPNAMYSIDHMAFSHTVHATRDIAAGEEVTIAYIEPFSDFAWRQNELSEAFGFSCTCQRCTHPAADDAILTEIRTLEAELGDWDTLPTEDSGPATEKAEHLIELYQKLKLEGFMNTAYGHAALAFNSVGVSERATMYARKALNVAKWRHGNTGSRAVGVWEEFLEEGARMHWSWNRRRQG